MLCEFSYPIVRQESEYWTILLDQLFFLCPVPTFFSIFSFYSMVKPAITHFLATWKQKKQVVNTTFRYNHLLSLRWLILTLLSYTSRRHRGTLAFIRNRGFVFLSNLNPPFSSRLVSINSLVNIWHLSQYVHQLVDKYFWLLFSAE